MTITAATRRKRGVLGSEGGATAVEAALVLSLVVGVVLIIIDFARLSSSGIRSSSSSDKPAAMSWSRTVSPVRVVMLLALKMSCRRPYRARTCAPRRPQVNIA